MGRNGQSEIADIVFRPFLDSPIGMDLLDFAELRTRGRVRGVDLHDPQRPAFHHLIAVESGTLRHTVDFTEHTVTEGGWLWVQPGQVHHFSGDLATASGTLVIWQPGFLDGATVGATAGGVDPLFRQGPVLPTGPHADAARRALSHLRDEYADLASVPVETHIEVVRHLLSVLVLRLVHACPEESLGGAPEGAFLRFHRAVERDFASTRRVEDYAGALGYSVRTLTRACVAATGATAKEYVDGRVLLEAKRLLVHTRMPASAVAAELGFRDPSDFTKFFRRRDGRSPAQFRAFARGGAAD